MHATFPSTDPAVPATWGEVSRHAAFSAASRRLAANMLDLCDDDRRLASVFKDAGRYIAAMSAAYLHGMGGLTLPLFKQICADSGFLSAGRARSIVEFLQYIGYLELSGPSTYRPTALFLAAWRRHLQAAIDAAAMIEPALAPLPDLLDQPAIFERLLVIQAARLHALSRMHDPFPALRRAFLHPYAGSQFLWTLTLIDTHEPVTVSLSDLSRRFDVTHLHVRRLLKRAHDEGFLIYHGHGRLTAEAPGGQTIALHYAGQLSELIESGRQVLSELPRSEAPA